MNKVAIVFYSGTGNTEMLANAISEGAKAEGAEVNMFQASESDLSNLKDFDSFAFGCPAMGAEVLEEDEFEPMFASIEQELANKKLLLFGSYGWGDGEWMHSWEERCKADNAILVRESIIFQETPNETFVDEGKEAGKLLATV